MLIANNPIREFSAPTANHPIGLSLEEFCWLFSRVKDLGYSFSSFDAAESSSGVSVINAVDALAALIAATSGGGVFSVSGRASRFLEDKESNISVESPRWFDSYLNIDLGKSVTYFGLYYPWIRLSLPNGVNSYSPRLFCGSVRFLSGSIPLYADTSSFIADGRIEITQSYDELTLRSLEGREAKFSAPSGFSKYSKASIGGLTCAVSSQGSTLSVILPPQTKGGHIRFESNGPLDAFLSLDRLRLS